MNLKDLTDKEFGFLKVLSFDHINKHKKSVWKCQCNCGNIKLIVSSALTSGNTKSCGCLRVKMHTKHGMYKSKEYTTWIDMINRCTNKNHKKYKNYGGRGIKICQRWRNSFEEFHKDMGDKPKGLSLDRENNNLHYSCGKCEECLKNNWKMNCRWANYNIQANNTTKNHILYYNGSALNVTEWAKLTGLKRSTIYNRLNLGWSIEKTLTTKIR